MPYDHAARAEAYREMIEVVEEASQQEKINILEDFIRDERRALDGVPQSHVLELAQQKLHWLKNPRDHIQPMGLFFHQEAVEEQFAGLNIGLQQ